MLRAVPLLCLFFSALSNKGILDFLSLLSIFFSLSLFLSLFLSFFFSLLLLYLPACFNSFPGFQEAMATRSVSSEIIARQRTQLLHVLQQDPDSLLDTLASRRLISEEEYEMLEQIPDALRKSRKLLIVVQKNGEESCQCFLRCLSDVFPEAAAALGLTHGKLLF